MTWNLDDNTRTLDRVVIEPGLAVWNYNYDLDRVVAFDHDSHGQRWWKTERGTFDSSRLWARHPETRQPAEDALRQNVETEDE